MIRIALITVISCFALSACDKMGVSGNINQLAGNWAQLYLPQGCVAKQIAAERDAGVAVLCEDGRIFH